MSDTKAPFIVWTNGYSEGWSPHGYETLEAALRDIADCAFHAPCVVTGPVLWPPREEPPKRFFTSDPKRVNFASGNSKKI